MPSSTKSSYAFTPTGATGGAVTPPESAVEQAKVAPAAFNRYNSWLDNSKPASEAASELSSPVSVTTTSSAAVVASRLEELKERSGLVAKVFAFVQVGDHTEYKILTQFFSRIGDADDADNDAQFRTVASTQRRYSSFLRLQDKVGKALGVRFSVPKQPFMLNNEQRVKEERAKLLGAYLNDLLRAAQAREAAPPAALLEFLGIEDLAAALVEEQPTTLAALAAKGLGLDATTIKETPRIVRAASSKARLRAKELFPPDSTPPTALVTLLLFGGAALLLAGCLLPFLVSAAPPASAAAAAGVPVATSLPGALRASDPALLLGKAAPLVAKLRLPPDLALPLAVALPPQLRAAPRQLAALPAALAGKAREMTRIGLANVSLPQWRVPGVALPFKMRLPQWRPPPLAAWRAGAAAALSSLQSQLARGHGQVGMAVQGQLASVQSQLALVQEQLERALEKLEPPARAAAKVAAALPRRALRARAPRREGRSLDA